MKTLCKLFVFELVKKTNQTLYLIYSVLEVVLFALGFKKNKKIITFVIGTRYLFSAIILYQNQTRLNLLYLLHLPF